MVIAVMYSGDSDDTLIVVMPKTLAMVMRIARTIVMRSRM